MIGLDVSTTWFAGEPTMHVRGELDLFTSPRLKQALADVFAEGTARATVDLTACEFLDSTALCVLYQARRELGPVSVVIPDRTIRQVFEITGLDHVFPIFSTLGEAMREPIYV